MGAYVSEPVCEKISSDEASGRLRCGASSMQGWRVSQEDAHNCILDYDEDCSFFALYDGHGGHEVAQYCSQKLPDFIRALEDYKAGDIGKALVEGFLGLDATITSRDVVAVLKQIADKEADDDDGDSDDGENVSDLIDEAHMPIQEVIEKYTSSSLNPAGKNKNNKNKKKKEEQEDGDGAAAAGCSSTNGASSSSRNGLPVEDSEPKEVTEPEENGEATKSDKGKSPAAKKAPRRAPKRNASQLYQTLLNFAKENNSDEDDEDDDGEEEEEEEDKTFEGPKLADSSDEDDEEENGVNASLEGEEDSDATSDDDDDDDDEDDEDDDDEDEDEAAYRFVKNIKEEPGSDSGCTAVVAILKGGELTVANAGDSRCVVSRSGEAVEMSFDHKPEDEPERMRVERAGGTITKEGRVNGGLNLSRAIGDHAYKQNAELGPRDQMITALPDIRRLTIEEGRDEFMVLACDGIWNSMSSQEVVDFVRARLDKAERLSGICEQLFDHCLAPNTLGDGTGCDNMTAIIVRFGGGGAPGEVAAASSSSLKRAASEDAAAPEEEAKRPKTEPAGDQ